MNMIEIHRNRIGENACDGFLTVNDVYVCDTAENTKHRPPAGTYRIVLRYNKTQHRKVPTLVSEDGTTRMAYLCMGNGVYNQRDGGIILGTEIVPGCVKWSREPFMALYNRINVAQRRGHRVMLKITE